MNDSIQEVFLLSENVVESLRLEVIKEVGAMYKVSMQRPICGSLSY
jgi:hypothetical protein